METETVTTRELILTKGYKALIDADDYEWLSKWKWTAVITGQNIKRIYAYRREWPSRRAIYLHRAILGASQGDIDHINGDTLDNRRSNLRFATRSQNLANNRRAIGACGYRGVTFEKDCVSPFRTQFRGRMIGRSKTAEKAARIYDAAAHATFGEFAKLNFPDELVRTGQETDG
jgi:HNH endonuclease